MQKKPGSPIITSSAADTQVISLTVKWHPPADNGGSLITSYRVVILKGSSEIKNVNITDPGTTSMFVEGLQRDTEYTVKVFARNAVSVGPAGEKSIKTNLKGFPAAVTLVDLPNITKEVELKIKWNQPQNFGAPITKYTVYQRTDIEGDKTGRWTKIKIITDVSAREFDVKLEAS
ncbi:hypothetical protein OS493_022584 [Desmophyllum pertusum]|uniref:Fibronectin type-III domain-containing protein n=1 Tax=Desmophyllum pertusum TaxID=174260 RepID=A0A9W9YYK2_9CNID|nr:hypothetical protein OS493_022584 [Desmophyllum pertusum]